MPRTNQKKQEKSPSVSKKTTKKVDNRKKSEKTVASRKSTKNKSIEPVVVEKTAHRKRSSFSTRKSFEDARKTGMVKLPGSAMERLFHKKLSKALSFYTGKKYTRKEVQLQSGVCKLLEAVCNIVAGDVLNNTKLFTITRGKVTTTKNDIACGLEVTNRSNSYGNLLVPSVLFKQDEEEEEEEQSNATA